MYTVELQSRCAESSCRVELQSRVAESRDRVKVQSRGIESSCRVKVQSRGIESRDRVEGQSRGIELSCRVEVLTESMYRVGEVLPLYHRFQLQLECFGGLFLDLFDALDPPAPSICP